MRGVRWSVNREGENGTATAIIYQVCLEDLGARLGDPNVGKPHEVGFAILLYVVEQLPCNDELDPYRKRLRDATDEVRGTFLAGGMEEEEGRGRRKYSSAACLNLTFLEISPLYPILASEKKSAAVSFP